MCLADCHARFPDIVCTPPCDVLVVAGDFTLTGSETEVQLPDARAGTTLPVAPHPQLQVLQFYAWATACQWRYCVLVPGFCELRAGLTPQRLQVRVKGGGGGGGGDVAGLRPHHHKPVTNAAGADATSNCSARPGRSQSGPLILQPISCNVAHLSHSGAARAWRELFRLQPFEANGGKRRRR